MFQSDAIPVKVILILVKDLFVVVIIVNVEKGKKNRKLSFLGKNLMLNFFIHSSGVLFSVINEKKMNLVIIMNDAK